MISNIECCRGVAYSLAISMVEYRGEVLHSTVLCWL